ncbi:DUF6318 family protein [Kribbella sp. WER1]
MTHRNRPTLALLACLATTTLLTACTKSSPEAGQPNTAPPPASSSSATTSTGTPRGSTSSSLPATPTVPPTRPTTATGTSLAAGEAFVRYYVSLMNYASTTGDIAPMVSASDAGCHLCKAYSDYVHKVNAANGGLKGDYFERVNDVPDLFRGDSGRLGGYAAVTIGSYTSNDASGKPVTSAVRKYKREFTLSPQQGSWVMYEMKLVPQ